MLPPLTKKEFDFVKSCEAFDIYKKEQKIYNDALAKEIIRIVGQTYEMRGEFWYKSDSRETHMIVPRQVAIYFVHRMIYLPLAEIAELFNIKSHSTILHTVSEIENAIDGMDDRLGLENIEIVKVKIARLSKTYNFI